MPSMNVILDGEGAWPDLKDKLDEVIQLDPESALSVAALPHGMQSGKPSVMFRFDLPDGKTVIAETSLAVFVSAARAFVARHGNPCAD